METRLQRIIFLAGVRLRIALLLLAAPSGCWALMGADLTQLTLKQLMDVEIARPRSAARSADTTTIAAIRAGCSDGMNVCDALRVILATADQRGEPSRPSSNLNSMQHPAADEFQEYNRSTVRREAVAAPHHMGFGGVPTVEGAMRALGFATSK